MANVYRRLPTGLSTGALRAAAADNPAAARGAALRFGVGLVLMVVGATVPAVWPVMFVGVGLMLWALRFTAVSRGYDVALPALILTNVVRFGKLHREAWQLEADNAEALKSVVRSIAAELDERFGAARIAFVDDATPEDSSLDALFAELFVASSRAGILAWATEDRVSVFADDSTEGIWLRVDGAPDGGAAPFITVLANTGAMSSALAQAAEAA